MESFSSPDVEVEARVINRDLRWIVDLHVVTQHRSCFYGDALQIFHQLDHFVQPLGLREIGCDM